MTIPRLDELIQYWSEFPPAHLLHGIELGNKKPHELWVELTDPLAPAEPVNFDGFITQALNLGIPMTRVSSKKANGRR